MRYCLVTCVYSDRPQSGRGVILPLLLPIPNDVDRDVDIIGYCSRCMESYLDTIPKVSTPQCVSVRVEMYRDGEMDLLHVGGPAWIPAGEAPLGRPEAFKGVQATYPAPSPFAPVRVDPTEHLREQALIQAESEEFQSYLDSLKDELEQE